MAIQPLSILIIEDERPWASFLDEYLSGLGYQCTTVHEAEEGLKLFKRLMPTVALVDWRLPDADGMDLIRELREISDHTILIMMTGHGTSESAVQAYKSGANDYLTKPFNANQVHLTINRVLETRRLEQENERLRGLLEGRVCYGDLVGTSAPMQTMYQQIEDIAKSNTGVLFVGEEGSGRELGARTLHQSSDREHGAYESLDLKSMKKGEAERALYGDSNGDEGALIRLRRGTLCLRGIEHLPRDAQARLTKTLNSRSINGSKHLETRVVGTINDDINELVESGQITRDLINSLGVVQINVPALRRRREDIPLLVNFFLEKSNARHGRQVENFSIHALLAMLTHPWPGNVAELEGMIDQLIAKTEGHRDLRFEDLPRDFQDNNKPNGATVTADVPMREAKRRFEIEYFNDLLRRSQGNMSKASRLSKVGRPYLYKKITDHQLDPNEFR